MSKSYVDHGHRHGPGGTDPVVGVGTGAELDIKVSMDSVPMSVGDGKFVFAIPADLNGLNLVDAQAYVSAASSSGLPTVQIRNVTQAADMLSTRITIDVGEFTSYAAATPSVVDTANDVATGDLIAVDVDVAGTGAKGLGVILRFDSTPGGMGAKGEKGDAGATGATGAAGADGLYATVQDEGSSLTARTVLNFVGAGVTATDTGTKTEVNIPGGGGSSDGWTAAGETWTYAAADAPTFTFTVAADVTTKYAVGQRIKLTQTTAKYFIVTAVSTYSGGNTTITVYGGTDYTLANTTISSPYWSMLKCPFGFPQDPAKWTVTVISDSSNRGQATPTNGTWYNPGSVSGSFPIGCWRVVCQWYQDADNNASGNALIQETSLSTANNSATDSGFTTRLHHGDPTNSASHRIAGLLTRHKTLTLAAKTTYYMVMRSVVANVATVSVRGDVIPTVITAECAYL